MNILQLGRMTMGILSGNPTDEPMPMVKCLVHGLT